MFFDDIAKSLSELLKPVDVGTTTIDAAAKGAAPKLHVDVNAGASVIAIDASKTIEITDGVSVEACGTPAGDLSANVEANGLVSGFDLKLTGVTADASSASVGAKFSMDSLGVTADGALKAGSDVTATACYAVDDNLSVGASAVVSSASGGVSAWSIAAQRVDGPTTLSTSVTDGGNTLAVGVNSELDANTSAGLRATLNMGERNTLGFALAVSKKLSSGDVARVVYANSGDTDIAYNTTLCKGADVTACLRLAKNNSYKTGFQVSLNN